MTQKTIRRALLCIALGMGVMLGGAAASAAEGTIADVGKVDMIRKDSGLPANWHQKGTFVEILVRSYQDSNGDGIGDLKGLTQRLDYLKSLGITGIWLMPIFKSDDHDHGYAVANYRDIEPDYGTLADFDTLLAEAHKRGIGIIIDYVINHASAAHPIFESAYKSRKSPYRDWFIFSDKEVPGWTAYSGDPWREGMNGAYYYAVFDQAMPDFNLRNPAVVDFHMNNLKFWLNRGVDGFRFDAVGVLFENSSVAWENQPENHVFMKSVQNLLDSYGNRYMVCEAPSDPGAFSSADSCGSAFAFGIQKHIVKSVKMGRVMPDLLYNLRTLPVERMGTILENHDYFAGSRLFKQFNGDEKSYKLATATLFTMPGRPFIYYGEEVGLGISEPVEQDDQSIRGPMAWNAEEPSGGFSTAKKAFRPNVENWKTHNVATEQKDPNSLLAWYTALGNLRHQEAALQTGSFKPISKDDDPIFAFVREKDGEKILVLINYAYRTATLDLPPEFKGQQWTALFPANAKLAIADKAAPKALKKAKKARKSDDEAPVFVPGTQQVTLGEQQVQIFKLAK